MASVRFADVKLNMSGVREALKSDGVRSELSSLAEAGAAAANSMARTHAPFRESLYGASTTVGAYTALGHVTTRAVGDPSNASDGMVAYWDAVNHHTLQKALGAIR